MTPRTVVHQVSLTMEFSRQEYWSGLPVPTPGDLPDPGIESASLVSPALTGRFFTTVPPGKPEDNLDGTFKMELTQPPEPHQEGRPPLLNHPWCPGHSGRNSDITSEEPAEVEVATHQTSLLGDSQANSI